MTWRWRLRYRRLRRAYPHHLRLSSLIFALKGYDIE